MLTNPSATIYIDSDRRGMNAQHKLANQSKVGTDCDCNCNLNPIVHIKNILFVFSAVPKYSGHNHAFCHNRLKQRDKP